MTINIVICGTPGTGKSALIQKFKDKYDKDNFKGTKYNAINLNEFAISNDCTAGYDEKLRAHILDEEKLLKKLESVLEKNPVNIIETIHSDVLPLPLVTCVLVCRCNNTLLFDRLKARDYSIDKINHNVQAEIFQTIADESRELVAGIRLVRDLTNETPEDLEKNLDLLVSTLCTLLGVDSEEDWPRPSDRRGSRRSRSSFSPIDLDIKRKSR